ncbi:hypothetical protein [Sphingobacterium multivorum]
MKYIMIQREIGNSEDMVILSPFTFTNIHNHSDMAVAIIESMKKTWPNQNIEAISAGFFNPESFDVYGHSESLNLQSDEGDWFYLRYADYNAITPKRQPLIFKRDETGV